MPYAASASLCRYGLVLPFQRRVRGVPTEGGALHADWKLADSGENGELAERRRVGVAALAGDQVVEGVKDLFGLSAGLSPQGLRHDRCRGGGDGAALALERHVLHQVAVQ